MIFPAEKLIYIPIPKTGTVSMATWLRQFMTEDFRTTKEQVKEFGHENHPTLLQCHQKLLACGEDPREYRSFSFIRNPWAHMYSTWAYAVKTGISTSSWSDWMYDIENNYENTDMWKAHKFKGFLDRLQSPFRNVDYVGTLEEYDKHVEVLKELVLDKHVKDYLADLRRDFPDLKVVSGRPLPERFKGPTHMNISVQNKQEYLTKYTLEQVEIVKGVYRKDIERFGFTFNQAYTFDFKQEKMK